MSEIQRSEEAIGGDCSGGACVAPKRAGSVATAELVDIDGAVRAPLVAFAGNPNTGKTTLFNRLTGHRAKVANYPGVTVERHEGRTLLPGVARSVRCLDVPGTYSLGARSAEEQIALECIAGLSGSERPDVVVLVVDGARLARNLYFVLQVLELGQPVVVAVNMLDELERDNRRLDAARLAKDLGVPVVPVSALNGRGVEELKSAIASVLSEPRRGVSSLVCEPHSNDAREALERVAAAVPKEWHLGDERRRRALADWALLSIDDNDELEGVPTELRASALAEQSAAAARGLDLDEALVRRRFDWIDERAAAHLVEPTSSKASVSERIDRALLQPVLGFVIFLALMTALFQALFSWSDPLIGLVETAFGHLGAVLEGALPAGFWRDLLVEGIVAGVGGVIVFLPQILLLFLFIAIMEGTGYMARVAFLMDRIMRSVGLHGRAFVPMMSGFACAIPAVMATRTMERRRDRLLTMMVVPLMTCSARLPVYSLMIAALAPIDGEQTFAQGLLMSAMYLFSTITALVAAAVIGRTVLKGRDVPLLLELPPYRVPRALGVLRLMWERSAVFVREAGKVILVCTIGMWLLLTFPKDAPVPAELTAQMEQVETELESAASPQVQVELEERLAALSAESAGIELRHSYAARVGRAIEPTIAPLGFDWEIGVGLIGAFAAREVFVSTLAVVYGIDESAGEGATLRESIRARKRDDGTKLFTPLVCLSLMVFFALACQCMSTLAVVKRETAGWRWPIFMFVYMTVLAWVASFVVYQGGRLLGFE